MKSSTNSLPTHEEADKILGYLLWRASKLWQRRMSNSLRALDIGSTQFVVLGNTVRLSVDGVAVSQRAIAAATAIDVMTVSQTVRGLVAKGLIQYMSRPIDKRERSVLPTLAGAHLLREALEVVSTAHEGFFRLAERDQVELVRLLNILIKESVDEKHTA